MYSEALKTFVLDVVLPGVLNTVFGGLLRIPLIGNFVEWVAKKLVGGLIDKGVIEFKDEMLIYLNEKAKAAYAPMITLLREAQNRDSMTEEEEKEYEKRLRDVVKNRPNIVLG